MISVQIRSNTTYRQTKFQRQLHNRENEAVYKFNFDTPKYHIVHNDVERTDYAVPRAYRSVFSGLLACPLLLTNVMTAHLPHRGQPVTCLWLPGPSLLLQGTVCVRVCVCVCVCVCVSVCM